MMKSTARPVISVVLATLGLGFGFSLAVPAQQQRQADITKPTVDLVQSIGCGERKDGNPVTWWLMRATDPKVTQAPFASTKEIEEAKNVALGKNTFQMIGVAEFLDVDGLLKQGQRSEFTGRESVNATAQLASGRKIAVKGLFIESGNPKRINLTSVIRLADTCR